MSVERAIYRRKKRDIKNLDEFRRSAERLNDILKDHIICRKLRKCIKCMVDLSRS